VVAASAGSLAGSPREGVREKLVLSQRSTTALIPLRDLR
jgi:hypothetical protein